MDVAQFPARRLGYNHAVPYRADGRDVQRALEEARAALNDARRRCEAAASALAALRGRVERERVALDEAVERADASRRRAIHRGLAGADAPRIRDAMRAQGAIAALERAMANKRAPSGEDVPIEEARAALGRARRARAVFAARSTEALERAQARLADAVAAHDEAEDRLAALSARA